MVQTAQRLRRPLHVFYPAADARIVLRTELDWGTDVEPVAVSPDGQRHEFVLEAQRRLGRMNAENEPSRQ